MYKYCFNYEFVFNGVRDVEEDFKFSTSVKPSWVKLNTNGTLKSISLTGNEIGVFDEVTQTWNVVKNYRGTKLFNKFDKHLFTISELGKEPSDYPDYTVKQPPTKIFFSDNIEYEEGYNWNGTDWVYDKEVAYNKITQKIAEYRYSKEISGLTLPNGMKIATDDRTKILIMGAERKAKKSPNYKTKWKGSDGNWVEIDGATITTLADSISDYVDTLFNMESVHQTNLKALFDDETKTAEDILNYNYKVNW